ncbi:MAG: 23S rRNA (adenine(2503)-C(2))-methyltransferase RlmN, partial [Candidatus Fonsibacter lacus]|nr:23S rRNA (adenine(2503)-C(2))-methyltransferase RlmN [Candidatus Fonsibacter lacus]
MSLKNFYDFNFQTLKQFLLTDLKIEEKKTPMRAKQLWQAVYKKGLLEFNNLTTLPVELRDELTSKLTLTKPKIADTQTSNDGTIKWLIELLDGNKVECVFIPEKTRGTLCISSQVGCTLNCR